MSPHTRTLPPVWHRAFQSGGAVLYALLAALGALSIPIWATAPPVIAVPGTTAAVGLAMLGGVATVSKVFEWFQLEAITLWFLMAALVVHMAAHGAIGGWPEWVLAQAFFLVTCILRTLELILFARQARWGVERRHLIRHREG